MLLKVLLSIAIVCVSGALSFDKTSLHLPAKKLFDVLGILKKKESYLNSIYDLSKDFDEAYDLYQINNWPDPDDYVQHSKNFYRFLIQLNEELSSDEFLLKREGYRNNTLFKKCAEEHVKRLKVEDLLLIIDIADLKATQSAEFDYILDYDLNPRKTSALCNTIVSILSIPKYVLSASENGTVRIIGDYVKASDISRLILAAVFNRELDNVERFTRAEIFASSKFLVDVDMGYGIPEMLNVGIMAPVWSQPPGERDIYLEPLRVSVHVSDLKWSGMKSLSLFGLGMKFGNIGGQSGQEISGLDEAYEKIIIYDVADRAVDDRATDILSFEESIDRNFDYHKFINEYLKFLLERRANPPSLAFLEQVYTYPYFDAELFNSMGFANELLILEDYYGDLYRRNFTSQLEMIYDTLDRRFDEYTYSPELVERTPDYVKLHDAISSAISSRLQTLSANRELELQLTTYISEGVGSSIKLADVEQIEKRRAALMGKKTMEKEIVREIQAVKDIIEKEVGPEVKSVNDQIDLQLDLTIRALVKLKTKVEEDVFARDEQLRAVRILQVMKMIGATVGAICGVLTGGFLVAAAAGGALAAASEFAISETTPRTVELPPGVGNVGQFIEDKVLVFDRLLDIMSNKHPDVLGDLKKEITKTREEMTQGAAFAPFEKVAKLLTKKGNELLINLKHAPLKTLREMQKILKVAQSSTSEVYFKYETNRTAIATLSLAAKQTGSSEIDAMNLYERTIHSVLVPGIKYLHSFTSNITTVDETKSLAEIDTLRWRTESILRDVQSRLEQFTYGIATHKEFLRAVEKLRTTLDLVFGLMSRIAVYGKIIKLVNYVGDLHAGHYDKETVEDPLIQSAINDLKYMTKYNTLITRSKRATNSYKLYAFPFTKMLHGLNSLGATSTDGSLLTTKSLAEHAVLQMGYLGLKMNAYKSSIIRDDDVDLVEDNFNGAAPFHQVFYRWKLAGHSNLLEELFSGQEIELNANITQGLKMNGLKFKRIELRFHSKKPAVQKVLDKALKFFHVKMTHSGDSYFRCNKGIYKAVSTSVAFRYSIIRNKNGKPKSTGASYKSLVKGNFLLSPYTQWKVQIEPTKLRHLRRLNDLKKKDIEITLEGRGQYVKGPGACSDDLPRYYKVVRL